MSIHLYVKQHPVTGLKYFGKTIQNPFRYKGSGDYWLRHLKVHGRDVDTIQVWSFDNQEDCSKFALQFSAENNIVESDKWANWIPEDGINNPPSVLGKKQSRQSIEKSRLARTGLKRSARFCKQISNIKTGVQVGPCSSERKRHIAEKRIGKVWYTNSDRTKSTCCYPDNHPEGWIRGTKIRRRPQAGLKRNRTIRATLIL